MKQNLIVLFLIFAVFTPARSQDSNFRFGRISLESGLSQTSIFSIVQDHQGFMWFGTQDGLNKYDGYQFTVYRRDVQDSATLSDNYVTVLYVDRSGTLWVGTRGGGLNRFVGDRENFIRYQSSPTDSTSLSNDEITSLYEDRAGFLWIGTSAGLNKLDKSSARFTRYVHDPANPGSLPNKYVQSLYEDVSGNLWVGMIGVVATLDRQTGSFTRRSTPWPINVFDALTEDETGVLWAATPQGVLRFTHGRWSFAKDDLHLPQNISGHVFLKDKGGILWIGSNYGLARLDKTSGKLTQLVNEANNPYSLSGNAVLSLYEDRTGVLWVGTYDGINKYSPRKNRFRHVLWNVREVQDAGWNKVRAFCEDEAGRLWIATQKGLATYDDALQKLRRFGGDQTYPAGLRRTIVWALQKENQSPLPAIWIGSSGDGLLGMQLPLHDAGQPVFAKYLTGISVLNLLETRSGVLWVGTLLEGLDRFEKGTGSFTRFKHDPLDSRSISHDEIWSLFEDHAGTLWIGTAGGGLNRFDGDKQGFTRYQNDPRNTKSLSDNKVLAIVEDSARMLWVGTYAGLNRFDPRTETFQHFTMMDGLPSDVVYGIIDDNKGNLWLSTNKGLSKFDMRTKAFRNYDEGDGLQSNEFNHGAAYRNGKGEILFGGINGFNIFNPDSVSDNPNVPEVVFTNIKVFERSLRPSLEEQRLQQHISRAQLVRLSYMDEVFSIEFAALEYTNPEKNQYAYRMEGFDKDWRYVGAKREATYTHLDPGEYVFRVKASNNDGIWNEKGASVRIIVVPPYWKTWWFRSVVILGFLCAGPIIYYRRVTALKRERMVQQEFSRKLIDSQESERKRIAAELHDSIGQDLLIIKNKLLLGLEAQGTAEQMNEIHEAIDHVSKSLKSVREISRNLRPIQLDQIGLTAALESVVETVAESSHIHSAIDLQKIDHLLSKDAEINLFRIVQESLNNVLKHSGASALRVELKRSDNRLELKVEDNGSGMKQEEVRQGLGLSSMNERARMLGGDLRIESSPGGGTRVLLTVPLREKQDG